MLAEFFGTFVLLLLGLGTCAVNTVGLPGSGRQTVPFGPDNWLINIFGWAFAVMLAAYVSGGISGAHFNPAVTLAFAVARNSTGATSFPTGWPRSPAPSAGPRPSMPYIGPRLRRTTPA